MKYVFDSCSAFKWLVPELQSDIALRFRDDFRAGSVDLLAPDVFPIEIAHAITRAERQNRMTPSEGATALGSLLQMLPTMVRSVSLLPRAYVISSTHRIGVYDCLYVALAEQESCEFVTSDDKLIRKLQPHFPFIVSLGSVP